MITIRQLLTKNDISRLDKRVLLREITGFSDAQLISRDDTILSDQQRIKYQNWIERLKNGEPLAYIIGYKEFFSRRFRVTPDTLIPRPDTEILVEKILALAENKTSMLDMGTGSGCIAISCKLENPTLNVSACDISLAALTIAKENAKLLNAEISFVESNWFQALNEKFAIIASNPPYIHAMDNHLTNLAYEPISALTDFADGLSAIRQIIKDAPEHLLNHGWLLIEHGYDQANDVRELLRVCGFQNISSEKDYAGIERISYGQWVG